MSAGNARATPAQKATFWHLVKEGIPANRAAAEIGMSRQWAWRQMRHLGDANGDTTVLRRQIEQAQLPAPKTFDQLDGGVRDTLADFNLFSDVFFCRHPSPWRQDAALRTVEWLLDRESRTYVDINTPPGAGKTVLWTHDIPCWLVAGGGVCDPAWGRALRFLLGSFTKNVAIHYVERVRRTMERVRPFFDRHQRRTAELAMPTAFGRFKSLGSEGDATLWRDDQFLVAQLAEIDVVEKEPTFQAASRQSGFLGERIDYSAWDDLSTSQTAFNVESSQGLDEWFENEAEPRTEPGGVLFLIGQRLSTLDLHRKRLDARWTDEDGAEHPLYEHVIYPAHRDDLCDGEHRQWNLADDGCLLDEIRLPWRDLMRAMDKHNYATVYQQQDVDPFDVLVENAWLDGGEDSTGFPAPGCLNLDRGFLQWPRDTGKMIDYVCVDPSAGGLDRSRGWWAIEWWSVQADAPRRRFLIWGARQKMQAGALLDWDPVGRRHTGILEDLMNLSCDRGHPILVFVIERNSAFKHLFQYEHFKSWRRKWVRSTVIPHTTGVNKIDQEKGVQALMRTVYRVGLKDLPALGTDVDLKNYMRIKRSELTTWPHSPTQDTVVCDWFGESHMPEILSAGRRFESTKEPPLNLPSYLMKQRREVSYAQ